MKSKTNRIAICLAVGIPAGASVGLVFGNLAFGAGVGVVVAVIVGTFLSVKQ